MPYETVASIPTNDYYDDEAACDEMSTPEPEHDCEMKTEAEACMLQAASVTACDKVSTPEPEHDYVTNPEVDACSMQAASVMTACDKVSTPEPEHDHETNPEADACLMQAASVMTACDKVSAPEPEHDYEKNPEAEACMLQAASVKTACDEVSTPVPDHDYEMKLEMDACAQQATPFTTSRDLESALEPDPDCKTSLPPETRATQAASETSARGETFAPEPAAVRPDEAFLPDDRPDHSVNAVRVLFQRPTCEPDPNRKVIYESFGMKTDWALARAAEANLALVTPSKPPESPPLVVGESQAEGVDGLELAPKRADPDDTKTAIPYAGVFTSDELNALEDGEPSAVADEKEEYEKELEERLFPLDEVELHRRMKKNAERQKELSLSELSALLDIPEEKLTRTRDSSPGVLSSPEYWLRWYKETLAASEAAKRANRDFRSTTEDENQAPEVISVLEEAGSERFAAVDDADTESDRSETPQPTAANEETVAENIAILLQPGDASTIASVSPPTQAAAESVSPRRWRALVRRAVYLLVKGEEPHDNSPCTTCLSPPSPRLKGVKELEVGARRPGDGLPGRARALVDHFGLMEDERLIEQIVDEVLDAYCRNAAQILAKVVERGLRCPHCRSLSELPKRVGIAKRVSFDCSSLFSSRSEALGAHGSRYDREESIHEYVYSVSAPSPKRNRKAGLLEVPEQPEPDNDCTSSLPGENA